MIHPTESPGVEAPHRLDSRAVPVKAAFREIGCGKTTGFEAIRAGTFPVPVFRVERRMFVARAVLDGPVGSKERGAGTVNAEPHPV